MIECLNTGAACENKECRQWLNYDEDLNCTLVTVEKNDTLTLREIADRMNVSFVRVKQIQDRAIEKLVKGARKMNL
jgi:DNA-directed RNA polymerase specialized sigma subunit